MILKFSFFGGMIRWSFRFDPPDSHEGKLFAHFFKKITIENTDAGRVWENVRWTQGIKTLILHMSYALSKTIGFWIAGVDGRTWVIYAYPSFPITCTCCMLCDLGSEFRDFLQTKWMVQIWMAGKIPFPIHTQMHVTNWWMLKTT